MIVYVVTSGEYSDYCIKEVFTDRKQAELFCAVHNDADDYNDYRVEEYEADRARLDGEVHYGIKAFIQKLSSGECEVFATDTIYSTKPVIEKIEIPDTRGRFKCIIPTTRDYDWEAREKIAEDYLAKYRAEKEGV